MKVNQNHNAYISQPESRELGAGLKDQKWFPYSVAACIGVACYVILNHLNIILLGLQKIGTFIYPVVLGAIIAYLVDPLAVFISIRCFRWIKKKQIRRNAGIASAAVILVGSLSGILIVLIPQLIASIHSLITNLERYSDTLEEKMAEYGIQIPEAIIGILNSSQGFINMVLEFISGEEGMDASITIGNGLVVWGIAIVLSIYFLAEKESLLKGIRTAAYAVIKDEHQENVFAFAKKCNEIMRQYVTFTILDALIVGVSNALFMMIAGMPYVGLISIVVAVTNMIPTFGPMIGGVIGFLILLLEKPMYAVIFFVFTGILQTLDGYVIKPKMYGNKFGIPGLWVVVGIIVGGRMFGVVGILLAIPAVAIIGHVIDVVAEARQREKEREKENDLIIETLEEIIEKTQSKDFRSMDCDLQ